MKFVIASDIHGDVACLQELLQSYEREQADKLILLGDLLYHGPRNDLPAHYAPKEVIALLNEKKQELLCVRGNCEADVDQMVLEFPVMADYAIFYLGDRMVFATHGHIMNEQNLPMLKKGDILLHGHTHVPAMVDKGDYIYLNPGSISIPKEGSERGYLLYEDQTFIHKTLSGEVLECLHLE